MLFSILFSNLTGLQISLAIAGFLFAIMIALVAHEFAHAFAAYKSGDNTAKLAGRLSLNPSKHVEPIGLLMFLVVGIGWAKPVPVNPFNYRNFRRGNFFVSIAGVSVNFVLGLLASLGYFLIVHYTAYDTNVWLWGAAMFFMFAMVINIALMIFNLLPVPPLDGFNMLVSFTKPDNSYMVWARRNSHWLLMAVLLISMFTGGIAWLRQGITDLFMMMWSAIFGV